MSRYDRVTSILDGNIGLRRVIYTYCSTFWKAVHTRNSELLKSCVEELGKDPSIYNNEALRWFNMHCLWERGMYTDLCIKRIRTVYWLLGYKKVNRLYHREIHYNCHYNLRNLSLKEPSYKYRELADSLQQANLVLLAIVQLLYNKIPEDVIPGVLMFHLPISSTQAFQFKEHIKTYYTRKQTGSRKRSRETDRLF
ncbi:MAG: hypothetical protein AABY22_05885 [Nanoarchaeota archaeon]